ncbi:MAG: recombination protein RecR [Ruminococcaceae bacterium]|nr:recombination protein RecR [Oscillospiraceae bacterium]
MTEHIEALMRLAEQFGKLQGVGKKTAMRMAFSVIELDADSAEEFANAIIEAKQKIHECPICGNLTDKEICSVCDDETRDRSLICVVEDVRAVISLEKVREFKGVYHVLGGVISPINGVTPDKIRFAELIARVGKEDIREVIVATNPTPDGEVTAMYVSKYLKPLGIKVTRLAYGIPVGSDLEYADEVTLGRALEGRQDV